MTYLVRRPCVLPAGVLGLGGVRRALPLIGPGGGVLRALPSGPG